MSAATNKTPGTRISIYLPGNVADEVKRYGSDLNISDVCRTAILEKLDLIDENRRQERIKESIEDGAFNGHALKKYPNIKEAIVRVLGTMTTGDYFTVDDHLSHGKEPNVVIMDETPGTCILAPLSLEKPVILIPAIIEQQKAPVVLGAVARILAIWFSSTYQSRPQETVLGVEFSLDGSTVQTEEARSSEKRFAINTVKRWGFNSEYKAFMAWHKSQAANK